MNKKPNAIFMILIILFSSIIILTPISTKANRISLLKILDETKSEQSENNIYKSKTLENQLPNNNDNFVKGEIIVKFKQNLNIGTFKNTSNDPTIGINSLDILNSKHEVLFMEKIFPKLKAQYSDLSNIYRLKVNEDKDISKILKEYNENPYVEYAEPNYKIQLNNLPNDPFIGVQWPFNNVGQGYPSDGRFSSPPGIPDADIDAPEAWDIQKGNDSITVAVIDTGVDYTHPDLEDNIWINSEEDINKNGKFDNWRSFRKKDGVYGDIDGLDNDGNGYIDDVIGWDFCYDFPLFREAMNITCEDNDPMDEYGHGTHCAGIIGAVGNNSVGVTGVCWNVKIMSLKIAAIDKLEKLKNYVVQISSIAASKSIIYAADNGADVISMSWNSLGYSDYLKDVVDYAFDKNVVLVAGAGNSNNDQSYMRSTPDCYPNVISVAATDSSDKKAVFSDYGFLVDVTAPGVDILSLRAKDQNPYFNEKNIVEDEYLIASGTSMACPMVSGLAALLLSEDPSLKPAEVMTIIRSSTDRVVSDKYIGTGRINAKNALEIIDNVIVNLNHSKILKKVEGNIKFNGTVKSDNLGYYTLEYGYGIYPNNWVEINNETEEVDNGYLGCFNASTVDDGLYTIRLKMVSNNNSYYDETAVFVNNYKNIFIVDKNATGNFTEISEAVIHAGDYDTIYVKNGTYEESFLINNGIDLIGENKNSTMIKTKNGVILINSYNQVKISGFSISSESSYCIGIQNDGHIISDNVFVDSYYGVRTIRGGNKICNNVFKNNQYGISLSTYQLNNSIENNIIYNNIIGIFSESSKNLTIKNNIISDNDKGIAGKFYNAIISNNNISKNSKEAFLLEGTTNSKIENNILLCNGYGFYLNKKSNSNIIFNNTLVNNNKSAVVRNSFKNMWKNNYWDKERRLPKTIIGFVAIRKIPVFPLINIDWHPAKEPYEL